MFYSFNDASAPTTKQIQYFEMLGNRALWYNGWKAVTYHGRLPWENEAKWSFDEDKWELYNVEKDFSECNDLADKHPDKLRQLVELWWAEAGKYNVLPLDDRTVSRLKGREEEGKEGEQKSYLFYPGTARIPVHTAPRTLNRSYNITAELEIPTNGAEGPIVCIGGSDNGWSLYIKDKRLVYCYNYLGRQSFFVRATKDVPSGKVKIGFEFEKTGTQKMGAGGNVRLYVNNDKVGEGEIPKTAKFLETIGETFDIARDTGTAVTKEYNEGSKFTGTVKKVIVELVSERHIDAQADARIAMKRQ